MFLPGVKYVMRIHGGVFPLKPGIDHWFLPGICIHLSGFCLFREEIRWAASQLKEPGVSDCWSTRREFLQFLLITSATSQRGPSHCSWLLHCGYRSSGRLTFLKLARFPVMANISCSLIRLTRKSFRAPAIRQSFCCRQELMTVSDLLW